MNEGKVIAVGPGAIARQTGNVELLGKKLELSPWILFCSYVGNIPVAYNSTSSTCFFMSGILKLLLMILLKRVAFLTLLIFCCEYDSLYRNLYLCFLFLPLSEWMTNSVGATIPISVKEGDKVLLPEFGGQPIKIDGKDFHVYRDEELIGVLHD